MFLCRRLGLVLFAILIPFDPLSTAAQELTEEDALRRLDRENARMRALAARVELVRAESRGRSLAPNPSVFYSREDAAGTQDDFLAVQQSVPISGRLGLLNSAGNSALNAAAAQTDFERLQLRSDFRASFYALLLAQQRVTTLEAWTLQLREIVSILQQREQEGEGSRFDRLRAERESSDAAANLASAQVELAQARSRMAAFLAPGTDPTSLRVQGSFSSDTPVPQLGELMDGAWSNRGDYMAAQLQLEQLGFERRAAARLAVPEPILSAGLKRSAALDRTGNGYLFSVTLPVPLFDRGQTAVARLRAAGEQAEAELLGRRSQIETEVSAALETVRLRRRMATEYARQLSEPGADLSQIGRLAYEEGEQGILELLDAYRVSLAANLRSLELDWSAKQAGIELDRVAGREVLP